MSHTTVSQQAEQVRVGTGPWATRKDDRSRRKIICRRGESRSKLHVKSQRLRLRCNRATMAIDNRYIWQQIFEKGEIAVSTRSSPTDKLNPTERQPCETSTKKSTEKSTGSLPNQPRFYWSRLSRAQPWSQLDGHWSELQTTITASSSMYETIPLTDDYQLQQTFYRACGSTA